jgi:DNA repair protein RadC
MNAINILLLIHINMDNKTLLSLPKEERPRERLLKVGAENLSTTELLAIILSTGTHGSNVLEIAQELLSIYDGKLDRLFAADVQELSKLKGMKGDDYYFKSADDIANYFMPMLRFQKQEYLMCIYLNTRGKMLKSETISIGDIEGSMFYPREIFRGAIATSASAIALIHNHPSGDPAPSDSDIKATEMLRDAGKLLGISIMDHVIIGDGRYCSMMDRKLI